MTKAVIVPFHKYTPFGKQFYEPLLDFFLQNMKKYQNEYDHLYLIDSDWNIPESPDYTILKKELDGHHWVQFKWAIPQIKEDAMLFLDNDVVIYRKGVIKSWFDKIEEGYNFVGSFDGSGTSKEVGKYPFLTERGYKRMGSYYFILTKKLLGQIEEDYTFEPKPEEGFDSFGKFTLQMLNTKPGIWEIEDDRCSIYLGNAGGILEVPSPSKNLGYYHIRAGSTPAYLLATKRYGDKETYDAYINNQPKQEILRHCVWYDYMLKDISPALLLMLLDMKVTAEEFYAYKLRFKEYHGLV